MVFITLLSLFSFSGMDLPGLAIPYLDKVVHFFFYFVAAILGSLFLRERLKGHISISKTLIITLFVVILYGMIIEVIQSGFTTERSGEWLDVSANSIGAFAGIGVIKFLFSDKTGLKWKF